MQRVGYLLYRQRRRFQLRLRIHNHHIPDNIRARLPGHLLDDGAEVGRRNPQLLRVERDIPLLDIVVDD